MSQTAEELSQQPSAVFVSKFTTSGFNLTTGNVALTIPQMIPEDELPFWTPEWQELINEGRAALAEGDSVEFANFRELASWLLSPADTQDE